MNVLEKILKEIEEYEKRKCSGESLSAFEAGIGRGCLEAKEIIRSHMDHSGDDTEMDGWIPVEEGKPEIREIVKVTVHSSEWIGDYDSEWVSEEEKMYHPEEYHVHDGYLSENGVWMFYDDKYSENICEKKFGTNKGRVYDVVTAWQSLPEPYKGGE